MTIDEIKKIVTPILEQNGVEYAGVFGSMARGEARSDCDVDIVVKFKNRPTFDGYLRLDEDLRKILGREIDLVTEGAVNKFLRPYIERDIKTVYGQR